MCCSRTVFYMGGMTVHTKNISFAIPLIASGSLLSRRHNVEEAVS